jgi:hypothetical protein
MMMILTACVALCWSAVAQPGQNDKEATGDSSKQRQPHSPTSDSAIAPAKPQPQRDLNRPRFPSPEQIAKIKNRQEVIHYPGVGFNFGMAVTSCGNSDLNQSYANMESAFGTVNPRSFSGSQISYTFGFRLRFSRSISAWWEHVYGGTPAENEFRISSVSLSLLYTLAPEGVASLSIGIGAGPTRIRAMREYDDPIGYETYLEKIELDTGQRWTFPLIALLEIRPSPAFPRHSLFVSMRYVIGPTITETVDLSYGNITAPIKIDMSSVRLTAGIAIAF